MPSRTDTVAIPHQAAPADSAPPALVRDGEQPKRKGAPAEKPDLLVRAVRWLWRTRAVHGPVTVCLPIYLTAQAAYAAQGGQDVALTSIPVCAGLIASNYQRVHRRRAGRPLVRGQKWWHLAVIGAVGLYLGISSVISPRGVPMEVFLGVLDAPLAATWWFRDSLIDPAPAEAPAEQEQPAPQASPQDELAAKYAAAWKTGIAGLRGAIPNSELVEITANADDLGGGVTGTVLLAADGGTVTHIPENVAEARKLIHQAMLRANPTLHPANMLIEPQLDGTALLKLLKRNPLTRVQVAQTSGPGTFTHRVGRTSSGEPVEMTLFEPGFGRRHRGVVGSTGSGKSSVMNLLIGLDGHTFTDEGLPLSCPIICDPHGGVSYAPWLRDPNDPNSRDLVRVAHTPEQIAGAMLLACIEIKRRLEWMRLNRVDLIVPSPEMPMVPVYMDEILSARAKCQAAGLPIEPMLEMIANEGRKTCVTLEIGMIAFSEEVLHSTLILDALSGSLVILRSKAASTGLKVNTGNWSAAANPQNIVEKFADGTATTGLGYYLRGDLPPLTVRYDYADATIADGALFADAGPVSHVPFTAVLPVPDDKGRIANMLGDLEYWVGEFNDRARHGSGWTIAEDDAQPEDPADDPAETQPEDAAPETDGEPDEDDFDLEQAAANRPSLMDMVTGAAADGDSYARLSTVLSGVGMPMSIDDLHAATGIAKSTISMAFGRRRAKNPPEIIRITEGRLVWYALPGYEHVPPFEGASR